MNIYSGSSNKALSSKISQITGFENLSVSIDRFENGEARVFIPGKAPSKSYLLQSFSRPVDETIIEFCLLADALKRQGAENITAIIPWLGYSKQDKVFRPGEALSVKVIAKILETAPLNKIICVDLHNSAIAGFFETPLINIPTDDFFIQYCRENLNLQGYTVIAPDAGSIKKSSTIAQALNLPIVYIDKVRNIETGEVVIHGSSSEIKTQKALIFDDIIATGSTILKTADYLSSSGIEVITVLSTHHLYLNKIQDKIDNSPIDRLIVTDTVEKPSQVNSKKLSIISVDALISSYL